MGLGTCVCGGEHGQDGWLKSAYQPRDPHWCHFVGATEGSSAEHGGKVGGAGG